MVDSSQLIPSLILSTTLLKLQRNLVLILQLQGFALPCFSGQTFYKLPYYSTKTHNAPKLLKLSVSYLSRDFLSFLRISVTPLYDGVMESLTFLSTNDIRALIFDFCPFSFE